MASTARRLLVAVPTMADPTFARTVVFMIEHSDEGAIGLVLNRPTDTTLVDALPDWADVAVPPAVAFVGGPVQQDEAVIGLARLDPAEANGDTWAPLVGAVGTVDLAQRPDDFAGLEGVRIFAGYAGWAPGQLDAELAQGGWHVLDAHADDLLTRDPSSLWRAVLRREGGDLAVAANFPLDPGTN